MRRINAARVKKGLLRYMILDAISMKPMHGYEIIKYVELKSRGIYSPSPGSIYPILKKLKEEGLAEEREEDGRKVYTITERGMAARKSSKTQITEAFLEGRVFRAAIARLFDVAVFLYLSREKLDEERAKEVMAVLEKCDSDIKKILQ
jgi:Predicted transcriptional regulators